MPDKPRIDLVADPAASEQSTVSETALVPTLSPLPVTTSGRRKVDVRCSSWRCWRLAIMLAVAGGMGAWLFYDQPWRAGIPLVSVERVTPGPVTRVLAVNGRIAPVRSLSIKSTVAGTLIAALADEGDVVVSGAVLARLDDTSQQAAVRQATAALDQQILGQAQALATLKRAEALGGTVSRVTLEDARAAVARADQEVSRLRALVDQAQFQLTKFNIVAPIDGTVLTRGVDPGQVVDLSTTLFTLGDLSDLIVETVVDESYATQIRTGMAAVLQLTGRDTQLDGTVSSVAPLVDAETGGLAVKIAFAERQPGPVGLTVTANIIVERRHAAMSVPRTALVTKGGERSVFLLEDGKTKRQLIKVVDWPADRLIVTDGLEAGDRLITNADNLADGQVVRVANR